MPKLTFNLAIRSMPSPEDEAAGAEYVKYVEKGRPPSDEEAQTKAYSAAEFLESDRLYDYWCQSYCWFKCLRCSEGDNIRGVSNVNHHVRENHYGRRLVDYTLDETWVKVLRVQHQRCHVCSRMQMKDYQRMRDHLKACHPPLTLWTYFKKYVIGKKEE